MSSKTDYNTSLNKQHRKVRAEINKQTLSKARPHVTESDLSPGGFPFHFKGPKKAGK